MKKSILCAAAAVLCAGLYAQEKIERLDSVVVSASRAGENTPVTFTSIGKDELRAVSGSSSVPMSLSLQPSVISWNEGGTGLGNSAITIRGSRGNQINVTLNGITLNDAESQEVFWVNIPSLTSILSSVQVQRGLGTSASGSGAFGASINMNTAFVSATPWARLDMGGGSWNTFTTTLAGSSGLSAKGIYATAAYSRGSTDGYIRNASVLSSSAFLALGWLGGKNSLRFTYLMGKQKSGITWNGVEINQYYKDRTYNDAGLYYDDLGNALYYPDATDNYAQHHLQLNYTHAFSASTALSTTLNYTRGDGYDVYYGQGLNTLEWGYPTAVVTDLIYRMVMGNNLWVLNSNLKYAAGKLNFTAGLNLSAYYGSQWGENVWAKALGETPDYAAIDWYYNTAGKYETSVFARGEYSFSPSLVAYADLQFRGVWYGIHGRDFDWITNAAGPNQLNMDTFWPFFNPRAGITYHRDKLRAYASSAIGNREPGRADIKESLKVSGGSPVKPEKMLDVEAGVSYVSDKWETQANLYAMEYWDMLLETGKIVEGYVVKENVPRAWRRGVEIAAAFKPSARLRLDANATLSSNRIASLGTDILLSPSVISMARVSYVPWEGGSIIADAKYVGRQYLDNTSREEVIAPAYTVVNLTLSQSLKLGENPLVISAYVNNFFNTLYYASGGAMGNYIWVYPQAPLNIMIKTSLSF